MEATLRRRRRPTMLAMLMALVMVLAACGGDGSNGGTEDGGDGSNGDADDGSATGGGGGEIKIGVITALTGSQAVLGEEISNGAVAAATALNEQGGVAGYTFEVISEDHAVEPDQAVSAAQKLINSDGVHAILSSFTGPTLAVRSLALESDMFVLNGGAIGPDLVDQPGLYSTLANASTLYWDLTDYMVTEYDATTVGVIHTDEAAGIETNEALREEICPEFGCEVIASEASPVGTTDWAGQIERVSSANPDLILTVVYGDDIGYLVRQIRERGIEQPVGIFEWQENAAEIASGIDTTDVIAVLDLFDADTEDPEALEFIEIYEAEYGEVPGRYAANYYEHVRYVIAPLIENIAERGEDPTEPGALAAELEALIDAEHQFESLYGEGIILLPDGTVNKPIGLFRIEDGVPVRFLDIDVE